MKVKPLIQSVELEAEVSDAGEARRLIAVVSKNFGQGQRFRRQLVVLVAQDSVSVEVIDLRSVKPWDKKCVFASVAKTGRLIVADTGWKSFGASAEIVATVAEEAFHLLRSPVRRVALPDVPAPSSGVLEEAYFRNALNFVEEVQGLMSVERHH